MNSPNIDSPLMTNAEAMAYCRIKDPRVAGRGYLERAFSAIWRGRSYPVFSRQTSPIATVKRTISCLLNFIMEETFSISASTLSSKRIGMGELNLNFSFFIALLCITKLY